MLIAISLLVSILITYKILKVNDLIKKEKMPKINFYDIKFLKYMDDKIITPVITYLVVSFICHRYFISLINEAKSGSSIFYVLLLLPLFIKHLLKTTKAYKGLFPKDDNKLHKYENTFIICNYVIPIIVYVLFCAFLSFIHHKIVI
ncbi:hypothetical protein HZY83_07735 [Gemella sp. GH3]|uniref:hypothetical protein n=1 Tax=unclassified Gemella TaxID=2624949 RepID=UPI0015CF86A8|nr:MULTISPECIES: hypothetical protein [unclassified Gemella]MBF0714564.1 hypothetical protein [Gemella sp. GH3.1]NYS51516.1 hypothetical protein [Gemella sp. GH3]